MFFRLKPSGPRTYVQIVENRREGSHVRQHVLLTLGRFDELCERGQLDALLVSGSRLSEALLIISARDRDELETTPARCFLSVEVFERLWRQTGCQEVITRLAAERKFLFSVERAVFFTVLHRLLASGSDRSAMAWREKYAIKGVGGLDLQHFYRTMGLLGEELPFEEQAGATPFSPRCVKDQVEEALFLRNQDLFSGVDVLFFDTTSIYFEGEGGETLGEMGHSKDHRPDLKQMVVGMVLDGEGHPVCCEMWPGNTTDVKTLLPVVERLKKRFGVVRICIVADRGMISAKTIEELENRQLEYILGARMRSRKEVREEVLTRAGRYHEVRPPRQRGKDPAPLKVKEVFVDERRYVVCLNEEEAEKDAKDRDAIVEALKDALRKGDKSLVGNRGYRRFLKTTGKTFEIDLEKVAEEERYDGKWVLRTNTKLLAAEVALRYKQLWTVEEMFRAMKSLLQTRPIFHKCDETIRGHVFCTYLALVLRKALEDRLEAAGLNLEWANVLADLDKVTEMDVERDGKKFRLRSATVGCAGKVMQAVGVALPPTVRRLDAQGVA